MITEGYKANEAEPANIRIAKALAHVLEHVDIHIYDNELLVGEIAALSKSAPIPEEYRELLVRAAGYSAYFVELSKPRQMDLLNRTELSLE